MIDLAQTIANMEALGMTESEIVRSLRCIQNGVVAPVRSAGAERQARYRQRHASQTVTGDVTGDANAFPDKENPQTPKEITPTKSSLSPPKGSPLSQAEPTEFEVWYGGYPHKMQRGAAERAFKAARKIASLEVLIAGVARYVATKPADVAWRYPSTWLNGKGWLDQPDEIYPLARGSPPQRSNPLSDAFGSFDQGPRYDDLDTASAQGTVLYLPAAAR